MIIVHVIGGLGIGGAEKLLQRLILEMGRDDPSQRHVVVSLSCIGAVGQTLIANGVEVHSLGLSSLATLPVAFFRLRKILVEIKPDVVQTWLYHADFIGGMVARACGVGKIFWGVHSTNLSIGVSKATLALRYICALLSYLIPTAIVCVAEAARDAHARVGYSKSRMIVIPNGFVLPNLNSRLAQRHSTRSALWGNDDVFVVGSIGRFNADKDPRSFVEMARLVASRFPSARFLMVGRGLEETNRQLTDWINATGHADRFRLVGEQRDIGRFLFAMDAFCLHSITEAFPVVVGEAMAAGVPCVVTDVGDIRTLVGSSDWVVPHSEPAQMADALTRLIEMPDQARHKLGLAGRARVESMFSLELMCSRYVHLYMMTPTR